MFEPGLVVAEGRSFEWFWLGIGQVASMGHLMYNYIVSLSA